MRLCRQTYDQLRILSFIAQREPDIVRVGDVAEHLGVSVSQAQKLAGWLVRAKLLRSTRGPHGGMQLAGSSSQFRLGQLIMTLEVVHGASPLHDAGDDGPMEKALRHAFSAMVCVLDKYSLADFASGSGFFI